jgi:hypothetical protein
MKANQTAKLAWPNLRKVLDCGGKQSATPLSNDIGFLKIAMMADQQPRSKAASQPPQSRTQARIKSAI